MSTELRQMGKTKLAVSYPWGLLHRKGTRLLCADGKVRSPSYLASTADSFFSTPCAMRIGRKYVTGYMTGEETKDAPYVRAYVFRQHTGQDSALPQWPARPKYDSREMTWAEWQAKADEADAKLSALVRSVHAEAAK